MSQTSPLQNARTNDWQTPLTVIVLLAIAAAGLYWLITQPSNLNRSVIGMNGLSAYAQQHDVPFQKQTSGQIVNVEEVGLRIVPLYDPNLSANSANLLADDFNATLRNMKRGVLQRKVDQIPTLIVLPKWRAGAIRLERLHPSLLIAAKSFQLFDGDRFVISQDVKNFQPETVVLQLGPDARNAHPNLKPADVTLLAPQTIALSSLSSTPCVPLLVSRNLAFVLECSQEAEKQSYWIVTDPDLFNNHGLVRRQNAEFAFSLLSSLSDGQLIVLDHTTRELLPREKDAKRERSFSDLARFFEYPFSLVWFMVILGIVFTLWHSWRRFGKAQLGGFENEIAASKRTVIDANAHILRASRSDGPLAAAHIDQRLTRLADDLLGAQRKPGKDGVDQVIALVTRRYPELGNRLAHQFEQLGRGYGVSESHRITSILSQFEKTLQEIRHEFGRSTAPRR